MNILVSMRKGTIRNSFIPKAVADMLKGVGNVIWNNHDAEFTTEQFREVLRNIDVCITGWGCPSLDRDILEDAEKLKLVVHTGGSVASVTSDYMFEKGIKIISGNALYAESVAEGVVAYILSALRNIPYYASEVESGRWPIIDSPSDGLLDQTVGLVGFGMITKNVIRLLKPFRADIKIFSRHITEVELAEYGIEQASLENIFSSCKVISLHASQRPETFHMIGRELLEKIPSGSLLVNTARGSLIDESVLEEFLAADRFKAVLDVYESEPLKPESLLRGLGNVILMPHMAGPTYDRRENVTLSLIKDIKRFFAGGTMKFEISKKYAGYMTI